MLLRVWNYHTVVSESIHCGYFVVCTIGQEPITYWILRLARTEAIAQDNSQNGEQFASIRETVESVWIAVVLAFVLRAFVLEAFVIPTGSMAPRLMGQHWQFDCPACGYHYAFGLPHDPGVSSTTLSEPLPPSGRSGKAGGSPPVCPNCGYRYKFPKTYAYGGDRVLVLKYLYRFTEPKPWDVVVFKNPQDNEQNYIKRLIGLPGQMLEIVHGNVFVRDGKDFNNDGRIDNKDFTNPRAEKECPWYILRKTSSKTQDIMWQVIFDIDYQPDQVVWQGGNQQQWQPRWRHHAGPEVWKRLHGGRIFQFDGSNGSERPSELRFAAETETDRERFCPIYAYNQPGGPKGYDPEVDVCYDLKLSFMFVPRESSNVRVGLHLSSFSDHFRAWVDTDGSCVLEHGISDGRDVKWDEQPWASVRLDPLVMGRAYDVALTNVERKVTLWVNGKAVLTSAEDQYSADRKKIIQSVADGVPTPTVAILARGGPAELWHVRLMRDVYYTCPFIGQDSNKPGRATTGNPFVLRKFNDKPDLDEFFVLGDNSPASLDSRLWDHHAPTLRPGYNDGTVPRYNMIGRAFFVYWPGGFRLPMLKLLPIVPNVGRMRLIR